MGLFVPKFRYKDPNFFVTHRHCHFLNEQLQYLKLYKIEKKELHCSIQIPQIYTISPYHNRIHSATLK